MLKFHGLQVSSVVPEAEDAVRVRLAVPDSLRDEYRFQPGQHVALRLAIDGVEERRTYSIVNGEPADEITFAIRVHPHGRVSRHLAEHLRAGDVLEVLTPNGSFRPRLALDQPRTYAAFAAGCGITPVHSIASAVLASSPSSRFLLFYGNRSRARTMLLEDLLALKDRYLERLSLFFLMSREPQDIELFNGRLDTAKLSELARTVFEPAAVDEFFLCGPGSLIDDLAQALQAAGVAAERIHAEHFTSEAPAAQATTIAAAQRVAVGDEASVTVIMDGRRRSFSMPMNGLSILDAAGDAGVDLPYSCRAGVCSTCRTRLVRGKVDMGEQYALEDWELEAGFVLACQSRPLTSELELNYDET